MNFMFEWQEQYLTSERSAYHLNGIFGNSGANSIVTVHPGGKFSEKKVIPLEVFPFSRFYRNSRKFLYHLSTYSYSARLFTGNTSEKEC